jgi:hypothetical protein
MASLVNITPEYLASFIANSPRLSPTRIADVISDGIEALPVTEIPNGSAMTDNISAKS